MDRFLTVEDVRLMLANEIGESSQKAWAKAHGFSPSSLNDVLKGRDPPSPRILALLGLELVRTKFYRYTQEKDQRHAQA